MDFGGLVPGAASRSTPSEGFQDTHGAEFAFDYEKQQLLKIVDVAWHAGSPGDWGPHPMFGSMTVEEWGKLLQIHIDYHLRQFAA